MNSAMRSEFTGFVKMSADAGDRYHSNKNQLLDKILEYVCHLNSIVDRGFG